MTRFHGRVGDRRRADARLIGEQRPLEPDDERAEGTARDSLGRERTGEDLAEGGGHVSDVDEDDRQAAGDVDGGHQRHETGGDRGDGPDAAHDHQCHEARHQAAHGQRRTVTAEQAVVAAGHRTQLGERLVRLEHVAARDAEEQDQQSGREGQDLAGYGSLAPEAVHQSPSEVVHRSAGNRSVGVYFAILHPERAFDELRGHAEESTRIIQKVAPGPPIVTAMATPAMLPSPTVPDSAAVRARK